MFNWAKPVNKIPVSLVPWPSISFPSLAVQFPGPHPAFHRLQYSSPALALLPMSCSRVPRSSPSFPLLAVQSPGPRPVPYCLQYSSPALDQLPIGSPALIQLPIACSIQFSGPRPASHRLQYGFQALAQLPIACGTVPRPSPSFTLLAVHLCITGNDGKLGEGLGMKLDPNNTWNCGLYKGISIAQGMYPL